MKKFKKSIEIKGENVQALFDSPIVVNIKKIADAVEDGIDINDPLLGVEVKLGTVCRVKRGNFIVQDVCGHWEVMDPEQWSFHKDDVIEEDADTSGDSEEPGEGNGATEEVPTMPEKK